MYRKYIYHRAAYESYTAVISKNNVDLAAKTITSIDSKIMSFFLCRNDFFFIFTLGSFATMLYTPILRYIYAAAKFRHSHDVYVRVYSTVRLYYDEYMPIYLAVRIAYVETYIQHPSGVYRTKPFICNLIKMAHNDLRFDLSTQHKTAKKKKPKVCALRLSDRRPHVPAIFPDFYVLKKRAQTRCEGNIIVWPVLWQIRIIFALPLCLSRFRSLPLSASQKSIFVCVMLVHGTAISQKVPPWNANCK